MKRTAIIKKYSDRRLYDTGERQYVTLEDIARMIRDGVEVQVVESRTGQDITRVILSQIIMEESRSGGGGLPLKLLHQLVIASDHAMHDFLSWYLDTALDVYKKAGSALRSGVSEARTAVTSPVEFVRNLLGAQPKPPERAASELDELRRQVEELEDLLTRRRRQQAPRKPRKPRKTSKSQQTQQG